MFDGWFVFLEVLSIVVVGWDMGYGICLEEILGLFVFIFFWCVRCSWRVIVFLFIVVCWVVINWKNVFLMLLKIKFLLYELYVNVGVMCCFWFDSFEIIMIVDCFRL